MGELSHTSYATFNRWDDERKANVNRNDNRWNRCCRFGGVRNFLHFSPVFAGEFCFVSWPFQPPSIFPNSSILRERSMYFLSSNDLVSQRIIKNILSTSVFLMANLTQSNFSSFDKNSATEIASIISINNLSIFTPSECLWTLGKIW